MLPTPSVRHRSSSLVAKVVLKKKMKISKVCPQASQTSIFSPLTTTLSPEKERMIATNSYLDLNASVTSAK